MNYYHLPRRAVPWTLGMFAAAFLLLALAVIVSQSATPTVAAQQAAPKYIVIGWNDLGMHCYNSDYAALAVLPPYNTLWAQVILMGDPPKIVTEGITVEYSIPGNTHSTDKTNFWDYAKALFGADLKPDVGLAGKGLSGTMDVKGDHFEAVGIPLTEFPDDTPTQPNYFQLAHLVVKDTATGEVLAETQPVIPVSSEMHCETCHNEAGNAQVDILTKHDEEEGTHLLDQRPVLCASCHADPALGAAGQPDVPPLSVAMHSKHAEESEEVDPKQCYACHPGPSTKCLRDVMSQKGTWCTDCHGDLKAMADPKRTPWKDEPSCSQSGCHKSQFSPNPDTLYRNSTGHGGLYCEACHNSTHAIWPSRETNDNVQIIALQGEANSLKRCTTCHLTAPDAANGPHHQ